MGDIETAIEEAVEDAAEEKAEKVAEEKAEEEVEEAVEEAKEDASAAPTESVPTQVNEAVEMTERFRAIAREESNATIMAWMALAESHKEPEVIVVAAPEPETSAMEEEFGSEEAEPDEEPNREHPYFRSFGSES